MEPILTYYTADIQLVNDWMKAAVTLGQLYQVEVEYVERKRPAATVLLRRWKFVYIPIAVDRTLIKSPNNQELRELCYE